MLPITAMTRMLAKMVSCPSLTRTPGRQRRGEEGGWVGVEAEEGERVINNVSGANNFTLRKMKYGIPVHNVSSENNPLWRTYNERRTYIARGICCIASPVHCSISHPKAGHVRSFGAGLERLSKFWYIDSKSKGVISPCALDNQRRSVLHWTQFRYNFPMHSRFYDDYLLVSSNLRFPSTISRSPAFARKIAKGIFNQCWELFSEIW